MVFVILDLKVVLLNYVRFCCQGNEDPLNWEFKDFRKGKRIWKGNTQSQNIQFDSMSQFLKIWTFWNGHKNLKQSYLVNVKSSGRLFEILWLNFKYFHLGFIKIDLIHTIFPSHLELFEASKAERTHNLSKLCNII